MAQRNGAQAHYLAHLNDQTDECMLWPYGTDQDGYGEVTLRGVKNKTHVLACIAHHGPRPEGMQVAHGPCHNPACWNGRHLSWKTQTENQRDRLRDGTHSRGASNPRAKLTEAEVGAIRRRHATGVASYSQLAEAYGVAKSTVAAVVQGRNWPPQPDSRLSPGGRRVASTTIGQVSGYGYT